MAAGTDYPCDDDIYSLSRRRAATHRSETGGLLVSIVRAFLSVRWQLFFRSDACRVVATVTLIGGVLLFVRLSSFERALHMELDKIDAVVNELTDEHSRAHVLDLPVYFINADEDSPQRREIEERLARLRPPAMHRIPSVEGALHLDEDRAHGGFPTQTAYELGRTLSHLAAARQLMLDGHEAALIVEDSAHFGLAPRWPFRLSELVAQLPATWTTLQLYHTADVRYLPAAGSADTAVTIVPYAGVHMSGTIAYVLSRRGADALMRATRAGRAVHRVALATRNGLTDTILFEFPHAEPWAVWPRYIFAHPRARSHAFGVYVGMRQALHQARIGRAIVEHAHAAWPSLRRGPPPDEEDYPDDDADVSAMIVLGDVISATRELR